MSRDEIAMFWDRRARPYDKAYDDPGPAGYLLRARLELVLRLLGEGPGDLLDVGMGPGRLSAAANARGWRVAGVDSSAEMVALARERLPVAEERFVQATSEDLPFADARFDAVAATGALEYAADLGRSLAELRRVLRPGGIAVLSYPNTEALYPLWYGAAFAPLVRLLKRLVPNATPGRPRRARPLRRRQFEQALATAGLATEAVEYVSFLPALAPSELLLPRPTVRLARRLEQSGRLARGLATQLVYRTRAA